MDKVKKHTIRVRYVILSVIGFVLAVIIGIVTIALVSYKKQPKLTDGEKQELDNTDLLKRQTSPEREMCIRDSPIAIIHIYAQVFGIIKSPTFGLVLLNKVTGI